MSFFANFYNYSITYSILDFFSELINNSCSEDCINLFLPRLGIIAILVFSVSAILHQQRKITLFYDKTDALLTIFTPLISLLPVGILSLLFYFLNFDFYEYWIKTILTDLYSITLLYLLFCSFRFARKSNANSTYGFLCSCFGRLFSIVSVITLIVGIIALFSPKNDPNRYQSQFELDYNAARSAFIIGGLFSGLTWLVLKLTRYKQFGSVKDWIALR